MASENIKFSLILLLIAFADAQRDQRAADRKPIALDCKFETITNVFAASDSFYACTVNTVLKNSLYEITSITPATHPDATKTNAEVTLLIIGEDVEFFPSNLNIYFPSLEAVQIKGSIFRQITKNDLTPLSNLKFFTIVNSPVQILEKGLFSSNSKLELIDITSFLLFYIDSTAFNGLTLTTLKVTGLGPCALTDTTNLQTNIAANCQNVEVFTTRFHNLLVEKAGVATDIETCKEELRVKTGEVDSLKAKGTENDALQIQITAKNTEISGLNTKVAACDSEKATLRTEITRLEDLLFVPTGNCKFTQSVDFGYTCLAWNVELAATGGDANIRWTGTHRGTKANTDVTTLLIDDIKFQILPNKVGESFANLKNYKVNKAQLTNIKKNDFVTLENLEKLIINENEIASVDLGAFDLLTKLTTLDLGRNKIARLPSKVFDKLVLVKYLNLNSNLLTALNEDFVPLNNKIETFYASGNKLKSLDIYFIWRLRASKVIDFSANVGGCNSKFDIAVTAIPFNAFFLQVVLGNC